MKCGPNQIWNRNRSIWSTDEFDAWRFICHLWLCSEPRELGNVLDRIICPGVEVKRKRWMCTLRLCGHVERDWKSNDSKAHLKGGNWKRKMTSYSSAENVQTPSVTVTPVTVTNRLQWQFWKFRNYAFVSKNPLLAVTHCLQWHFYCVPTLSP